MKKLSILLIALLIGTMFIEAQTPNQFKYQAILRDASGAILSSISKTVVIEILQGSITGTSIFSETHNVTTTAQGLININIGSFNTSGLANINWANSTYFIKITVDGIFMGTSQLLSVPYAIYSKGSGSVKGSIDANSTTISNVATPVNNTDGVNKAYVDMLFSQISNLSVSTNVLNLNYAQNSTAQFNISSNVQWTISSNQTWLTPDIIAGYGNETITLTSSANTGNAARTATVAVICNGLPTKSITVNQGIVGQNTDQKPNWTSTYSNGSTMTYVANISKGGVIQPLVAGDELAAFVGTECRGKGTIVTVNGSPIFFLSIGGVSGETITFKYYQINSNTIFSIPLTKTYKPDENNGTIDVPYTFIIN
jgi:hypothetical protein